MHGELGILGEMCHDHSANGIGIEHASIEYERYEMVVQNDGLEVEIRGNLG